MSVYVEHLKYKAKSADRAAAHSDERTLALRKFQLQPPARGLSARKNCKFSINDLHRPANASLGRLQSTSEAFLCTFFGRKRLSGSRRGARRACRQSSCRSPPSAHSSRCGSRCFRTLRPNENMTGIAFSACLPCNLRRAQPVQQHL